MLAFPTSLFNPSGFEVDFELPAVSGGVSLTNDEDRIHMSGGGRWFAEISVDLVSRQRILAWRGFRSGTDGGSAPFIYLATEVAQQPVASWITSTFTDDTTFDDSTVFYASANDVEVAIDAALRATEITLTIGSLPEPIAGGMRFSILHPTWGWRMYQVGSILEQTAGSARFQFHPPLREAVPLGTVIDFDNPRFVARIDTMAGPMSNPKAGRGTARFVEDMTGVYP